MKLTNYPAIAILSLSIFFMQCSKSKDDQNTRLQIILADDAGNKVPNANIKLYNISNALVSTGISNTNGEVLFSNLEPILYYWIAESGCKNNRLSETSTGQPLVPNAIIYGYSVLSESGPMKITNNSISSYMVSDPIFNTTLLSNTQFITYHKVGPYVVHTENVNTPGIGKDTLIQISCIDTVRINIPL